MDRPREPEKRTGKKVAIIGSGPAGLAAAAQLNKAGHLVTVFERADRIGGLLMYGIPNFKLDKKIVDRRVKLMEAEGIVFKTNANVGENIKVEDLRRDFDAIVLCGGSTNARDLKVPGPRAQRHLQGDGLSPASEQAEHGRPYSRRAVHQRQGQERDHPGRRRHRRRLPGHRPAPGGARASSSSSCCPRPPESRTNEMPWPYWPMIFRTSSAHEEAAHGYGGDVRDFSINTKSFSGENGVVKKLHGIRLEWAKGADGRFAMKEIPGSEFDLDCDLCLLAMGFVSPEHPGPIQQLGLKLDGRGNVTVDENYMTSVPGVFSAGDMRSGQSLIVWAISEGRCAAYGVDKYLMGRSELPYLKLF